MTISPDPGGEKAPLVETDVDLLTIHVPSYLAGWNDAKAGRQYGEGRQATPSGRGPDA